MSTNYFTHVMSANKKYFAAFAFVLLFSGSAFAQSPVSEPVPVYYNTVFVGLCTIIVFFLIAIAALAELIKAAAKRKGEREKSEKTGSNVGKMLTLFVLFSFFSASASAQDATADLTPYVAFNYWGLGSGMFYLLVSIIGFEIWLTWFLYRTAMDLIGRDVKKAEVKAPSFIEKMNASVAIEKEQDIMLDHNYDGIRELDNDLPPWWKYGFYATIVFAVVYLFNYHVGDGQLQIAEYQEQMNKAKIEHEEYMKKAANLVDENNVTLLTDAASLASGKEIFLNNCAPCHGRSAEGNVGPNLTDDYWLHKGGIKDIFRSIKFGWPEKGMKSWEQDLGAKQIHEVASYVKSLHGTNPANPKERQGDLYSEGETVDSLKTAGTSDTLKIAAKQN